MTDELRVHLLDVGPEEYGDAILCVGAERWIQVDGGHPGDVKTQGVFPSIPGQIAKIKGVAEPIAVDLLVVTHGHLDHIGCLPELVATHRLHAQWVLAVDPALAWGRRAGDTPPDAGMDFEARSVVAGLREEIRHRGLDDDSLRTFLADAVTLEQRYTDMLNALESKGATVVRLGRSTDDQLRALLEAFAPLGLELLGPSPKQLFQCAEIIAERTTDSVAWVADRGGDTGANSGPALYRRLIGEMDATEDAPTDGSRPGAAINLQSIVLSLGPADRRVLLTGDMQLVAPQVSDPVVRSEVVALRERIRQRAPYRMVKIGHHGSPNAFDASVLAETAADLYGISAGAGSTRHPDGKVLKELGNAARTWARTDHNGLSSFDLDPSAPTPVEIARGVLNDATANVDEVPAEGAGGTAGVPVVAQAHLAAPGTLQIGPVEVVTRISAAPVRVRLDIQVETGGTRPSLAPDVGAPAVSAKAFERLLFITRRAQLEANIGQQEAAGALGVIESAGGRIVELPEAIASSPDLALRAGSLMEGHDDLDGIVLVGGYDVVPSIRLDALPASIRGHVAASGDPDEFIVWNDEAYGDRDADGLPELPVSRVPDGRSGALLQAQLGSRPPSKRDGRGGIRNVKRPFAAPVFAALPGTRDILVSAPVVFNAHPVGALSADHLYFMLHGDYVDTSRFWGEGTPGDFEAMNADNVPDADGSIILAGSCWGALIAQTPASRVVPGRPVAPRTPEGSIAMSFLLRGAQAFVGCTGAHYSPSVEPYEYFGGPLHRAFWRRVVAGVPAARALFEAKVEYVSKLPHGQTGWSGQAIEYKVWRQFTCLGLGWPGP